MTDQCDQLLSNKDIRTKYKLRQKPIGKGAFSTVYLGSDNLENLVAIKQIPVSKIQESYIEQFFRELEISMKLDHPNIVKCHEIFRSEKYWYIVNEYCDYGTLRDLNANFGNYDLKSREIAVKKILIELKNALHYLISNNIIHRDLKPTNILLKTNNQDKNCIMVKLADFGFARHFTNEISNDGYDEMIKTICGSPIYMAPEMLINLQYNMKADLWSFGVIMYELLYRINPFLFPKNMPELRKFIIEQKINYENYFTQNCIDLMKQLLSVNPEERISWQNFFSHQWFNEDNNLNNILNNIELNNIELIKKDYIDINDIKKINIKSSHIRIEYIEKDYTEINTNINTNIIINPDLIQSNYIKNLGESNTLNESDFEIIEIDNLDISMYQASNYNQNNSFIQILSNKFTNFFRKK